MKVGSLEIVPIIDGTAYEPIEAAVSHPDGKRWDCADHPLDENGRIRLDIGGFLIRIQDRVVLVDTGGGVFSDDGTTTGAFVDNLRQEGVGVDDVTDIFFTHMHWDHVGWCTSNGGKITFPNATIHLHQADWDYFMTGPTAVPKIRDVVLPIESHVEPFSTEVELIPGFIARPSPGHTPGTTIYSVHDGGERALLLGDSVHTVGEFTDAAWYGMWDIDKEAARAMRTKIAEELMATGDPFAPAHYPELAFGRLIDADGMRKFVWASGSNS